jgi:ribosomal protein S25
MFQGNKASLILVQIQGKSEAHMTDQQNTLETLLVDEEEVTEELLFDLLADYIRIGSDSGAIITQPDFRDLNAREKIIVILTAQKARKELGMVEAEWMAPKDISEASGINVNTIYPAVRELEEESILDSDDGEYRIPSYNLQKVRGHIGGEADD